MIWFIYCSGSGRGLSRQGFLLPGAAVVQAVVHLLSIVTSEMKALIFVLDLLLSILVKRGAEGRVNKLN